MFSLLTGKSSRIPVMLLNAPSVNPTTETTKLFISQPRRIAAKALVERLRAVEPDLRDQIALRMGHGVREYESSSTRAWFVTTGYLVRLMANHPEKFNSISYLVRAVDSEHLTIVWSSSLTCRLPTFLHRSSTKCMKDRLIPTYFVCCVDACSIRINTFVWF